MKKPLPEIEYLRKILRYEPDAGKLFWLHRDDVFALFNARLAGKEAFTIIDRDGYSASRICGKFLLAHRVIWAIVYGSWPAHCIDHINGIKADNRLSNLREATQSENGCNRPAPKHNIRGIKGVSWNNRDGKWHVRITKHGCCKHIGYFDNITDAAAAYAKAATELHGKFANQGAQP